LRTGYKSVEKHTSICHCLASAANLHSRSHSCANRHPIADCNSNTYTIANGNPRCQGYPYCGCPGD
jgi:hypothetical protein